MQIRPVSARSVEVCELDPLADMQIRSTCSGVEGGRFGGRDGDHEGLDLLAEVGTSLHAIEDGTVWTTGVDENGWGNYVIISSDDSEKFFLYAHLDEVDVDANEAVSEGTNIGEVGVSGNACR